MIRILKKIFTSFVILSFINSIAFAQSVSNNTLPTNPNVISGSANISQTANKLTVNQNTDKLITNWSSFNIGKDATVQFVQPSSTASALNRVTSSDPSYIFGTLQANGKIILINPNGVLFANGAKVDVGSIIASTLKMADKDYLSDQLIFEKDNLAGTIQNDGTIRAFAGGTVALIGSQVTNNGKIKTKQGTTALLAGDKVTLTLNGNRLIKYTIDQGALNSLVENNNAIIAKEGVVILSAKGLNLLSKSVVNNTGSIEAKGFSQSGGKIYLDGDQTTNSGKLVAASKNNSGGLIQVTGDEVKLTSTASLDASGATGGGTVLVGGDYQGKNPLVRNAKTVIAEQGSITKADAIIDGDGGKIIFWSDDRTVFLGEASVSGGKNSGDGGFGEISGKNRLLFDGLFKAPSKTGKIGSLLLDPTDIVVDTLGTDTATIDYQTPSSIQSSLASAGVTLSATNSIYINSAIAYSGATNSSLTFTAESASNLKDGTIALGANVSSSSGTLGLTFNGKTYLTNNSTLTSNGGNVVFNGDVGGAKNLTVNSGSGSTTFNSNIAAGFSGSYISGTSTSATIITSSLDGPSNAVFKFDFENLKVTNSDGTVTFWNNGTTNTVSGYSNTFTSMSSTTGYLSTIGGAFSISIPGGDSLTYVSTVGSGTATKSGNTFTIPSGLYIKSFIINAGSSGKATISGQSYTQDTIGISQSFSSGNKLIGLTVTSGAFTAADIGLANSSALSITNSGAGSVTGAITGTSATLTKAGSGELTLSGTNTYSGVTTINAGTLAISNSSALGGSSSGQGTTITSGAALGISGGISVAEPITISGTGVSSDGAIKFTSGNNTYSGAMTLAATSTINSTGGQQTISSIINGTSANSQALTVTTSDALTLSGGSVGATTSLSTFNASTTSGNLTLGESITTGNTGSSSIVLNAGSSASVGGSGSTSSGNIIISGSPVLTTGTGGTAKLFTGSISDSTGLTSFIGSASGKFRYNSDETTTNYTTALSSGNYTIYRQQPTLTITANNPAAITYGSSLPSFATTVSGYQNGDTLSQSISTSASVAIGGSTSTSVNYIAGSHTLTPSGAAGGLGYGLSYANGSLTINQLALTVSGITAANKDFDGTTAATVSTSGAVYSGKVTGDSVTVSTTGIFASATVGTGKTVNLTNTYTGTDVTNYNITNQSTTTANITLPEEKKTTTNSKKVKCELEDCNKNKLVSGEIVIVKKNIFNDDKATVIPISIKPDIQQTPLTKPRDSLVKIIILKPGAEPVVDKEYQVTIRGNDAILKENMDVADKTITSPGKSIGSARFSIENDKGKILEYNLVVRESGLEIRPLSFEALQFADKNKATVAGAAMIDLVNNLKLSVDNIKTIILDLIIDNVFEEAMFNSKGTNKNIFNVNYY
jgi:filamentous hemagglutinin family protein